jgi:hypothetical protein
LVADYLRVCLLELGRRHLHWAGTRAHLRAEYVPQPARPLTWTRQDAQPARRCLPRDRAAPCTSSCDWGLAAEDGAMVPTPLNTTKAKALAASWGRSAREEDRDRLRLLGAAPLLGVLLQYSAYSNRARPHQGRERCDRLPGTHGRKADPVPCRDLLGSSTPDEER